MRANKKLEWARLGCLCWRLEDKSALQGSKRGFALLGLEGETRDADLSVLSNQFSADCLLWISDATENAQLIFVKGWMIFWRRPNRALSLTIQF